MSVLSVAGVALLLAPVRAPHDQHADRPARGAERTQSRAPHLQGGGTARGFGRGRYSNFRKFTTAGRIVP